MFGMLSSLSVMNRHLRRLLSSKSDAMPAAAIRRTFIEYFEERHGHVVVPSSSVLPFRDRTVSFVNAGVTQFKPVVLAEVEPAWPRAVNSQKCIRIRGKHNDLDHVGADGSHHTFFEMLGNWSFGDYFKGEACSMAWDLLTNVYNIPKDRLYVTYFAGDASLGLEADEETRHMWLELGVPPSHVLPFGRKDNFWEMAAVGPCGPCTEIHYDQVGGGRDASALVNASPEVVELWNLVFLQHNRSGDGELAELRRRVVDTGMGFERLVAVLNGKTSNYETDVFRRLFDAIQKFTGHSGYTGLYGPGAKEDAAYRIVADHARTLTVGFADLLIPQIHNRLRAVFRRAMFQSKTIFGSESGLLKELSNHVADDLSPVYPEIGERMQTVHAIIDKEEELMRARERDADRAWRRLTKDAIFNKIRDVKVEERTVLVYGYNYLKSAVLSKNLTNIPGDVAFRLFDTYGMSLEQTKIIARRLGLTVDEDGFNHLDKDLRTGDKLVVNEEMRTRQKELKRRLIGTDRTVQIVDEDDVPATVVAIVVDYKMVDSVTAARRDTENAIGLVLDRTNMYPRHEGMRSDVGDFRLDGVSDATFRVTFVKLWWNRLVHFGYFVDADPSLTLAVNAKGTLRLDRAMRESLARSNSCRQVMRVLLSRQMKVFCEMDSGCDADAFYIDFAHCFDDLKKADVFDLENKVVEAIKSGWKVSKRVVPWAEVTKMRDLITAPGQTLIWPETQVVTLENECDTWRLACDGPVVPTDLSCLSDCIITSVTRSPHYKAQRLWCVTGEKAAIGRKATGEFLKMWDEVRDFDTAKFDNAQQMMKAMNNLKQFLDTMVNYRFLPHYIREAVLSEATAKFQYMKKILDKDAGVIKKMKRKLQR